MRTYYLKHFTMSVCFAATTRYKPVPEAPGVCSSVLLAKDDDVVVVVAVIGAMAVGG